MSSWELYDRLVASVPEGAAVDDALLSPMWTVVRADGGCGLTMNPGVRSRDRMPLAGDFTGMPARLAAELSKSWDFREAAVGLATVNAFANRLGVLPAADPRIMRGKRRPGVFGGFDPFIAGRRVVLVGHGPFVRELRERCDLTVLERLPQEGDLPDPACEYVLPQADVAFITASALANKTMPRLLELAERALTVVWGPSAPLLPALLDAGADVILGDVVTDGDAVRSIAAEGGFFPDFARHVEGVRWFRDADLAGRFAEETSPVE